MTRWIALCLALVMALPGSPTAAAFMVIRNPAGDPDRLIGVESDIAARTETCMSRAATA